jgi:Phosphoserine phosphatase RsbU, N-terminal domain
VPARVVRSGDATRGGSAATDLVETFRRNYVPLFLAYLSQRSEAALRAAYELGRNAIRDGVSILDLVQIHHRALANVLGDAKSQGDLDDLASAASTFFVEVLSTFDMTQRAVVDVGRRTVRDRSAR